MFPKILVFGLDRRDFLLPLIITYRKLSQTRTVFTSFWHIQMFLLYFFLGHNHAYLIHINQQINCCFSAMGQLGRLALANDTSSDEYESDDQLIVNGLWVKTNNKKEIINICLHHLNIILAPGTNAVVWCPPTSLSYFFMCFCTGYF